MFVRDANRTSRWRWPAPSASGAVRMQPDGLKAAECGRGLLSAPAVHTGLSKEPRRGGGKPLGSRVEHQWVRVAAWVARWAHGCRADDSEEHIIIAIAIGFDYSAKGPSYMLGVSCGRGTEGRVGSRRDLCEVS